MTNRPESASSLKSVFTEFSQIVSSTVLTVTVLCFVFGLLIENVHFAHFGVYSAELIRTEYILVGATFILLNVVANFSIAYGVRKIKSGFANWSAKEKGSAISAILLGLIAIIFPTGFFLQVLSSYKLNFDNWMF